MEEKFDALDQILSDLAAGQDAASVITDNPELAAEIEAAQWASSLAGVPIPADAAHRSRTRVLARAMQLRPELQTGGGFFQRLPKFAYALILALIFLLSWNGLVFASANALPGDQLYPAKLTLEKLRLGLALNPQTHQKVEEEYQTRRIDEVINLLALKRVEFVQFFGVVEEQWEDHWIIEGIEVRLLPETIILGEIHPGMLVEVEGATQPGSWVQASEIHLQIFSFMGTVEQISNTAWIISGREVLIDSDSSIDSEIEVGDLVTVTVESDDFGILTIRSITRSNPANHKPVITETPEPLKNTPAAPTRTDQPDETEEFEDRGESDETDEPDESDESDESEEKKESDEDDEPDDPEEDDESDEEDDEEEPKETDEP